MLTAKVTPQYLGFTISGDYDELNALYDAIVEVVFDDMQIDGRPSGSLDEILMSERLLALNYDLRHAYQGDREIRLIDNGLTSETMKWHGLSASEKNVVYEVNILYPEVIFYLTALNYLIQYRKGWLVGRTTYHLAQEDTVKTLLDSTICTIRYFQASIIKALSEAISKNMLSRILKAVNDDYHFICGMYTQWLDLLDEQFVWLSPAKRKAQFSTIARDIASYRNHPEYQELKKDIQRAAREKNCSRALLTVSGSGFPEDLEW